MSDVNKSARVIQYISSFAVNAFSAPQANAPDIIKVAPAILACRPFTSLAVNDRRLLTVNEWQSRRRSQPVAVCRGSCCAHHLQSYGTHRKRSLLCECSRLSCGAPQNCRPARATVKLASTHIRLRMHENIGIYGYTRARNKRIATGSPCSYLRLRRSGRVPAAAASAHALSSTQRPGAPAKHASRTGG